MAAASLSSCAGLHFQQLLNPVQIMRAGSETRLLVPSSEDAVPCSIARGRVRGSYTNGRGLPTRSRPASAACSRSLFWTPDVHSTHQVLSIGKCLTGKRSAIAPGSLWPAPGQQLGTSSPVMVARSEVPGATPEAELAEPEVFSILSVFKTLRHAWVKGVLLPLANFGMGKRSIWEGGVGLFIMSGVMLFALIVGWVRGIRVRAQTTRYQAIFEFGQACGIAVGTPVRIRGVDVGSVVGVRPSLEKIDAVVEIIDDKVVIPRNALIEVNQSGLISETLIDITPQPPIPEPTVGPTHSKCSEEGLIVCDRERISGHKGVSLDELVGICTKVAKEMDEQGVSTIFEALDKFAALADEAKPLAEKVNSMATDLKPMLTDLKDGELMKNLERLSGVALEAAQDIKQLNSNVMSDGKNTQLLRDSVTTLTKTLKNIESISSDLSTLTGDPSTRNHLKSLIESLSRIVVD